MSYSQKRRYPSQSKQMRPSQNKVSRTKKSPAKKRSKSHIGMILSVLFVLLLSTGGVFMFYPTLFLGQTASTSNLPIPSQVSGLNGSGTSDSTDSSSPGQNNTNTSSNPTPSLDTTNRVSQTSDSVYYYYSILSDEDRIAYDNIYQGLISCADYVDPLTNDSLKYGSLYLAVLSDHPEIFWTGQGYSYTQFLDSGNCQLFFEYEKDKSEIQSIQQKLNDALQDALDEINPTGNAYEDIKKAFEYVVRTVDYVESSPDNQHLNSSLINKKSVCAGYAKALQYLLQTMGYQSIYVTGSVFPNNPHAWVLVKIGDQYYSMDPTYADNDSAYIGYNPNGLYNYDYFLRGDDFMLRERNYDKNYWPYPECQSDY